MQQQQQPESDSTKMAPQVSVADRQRLIAAVEAGRSVKDSAAVLQLRLPTAYRILKDFRLNGRTEAMQRGGVRQALCKADAEMADFLVEQLQMNPLLTLNRMAELLAVQFPLKPRVSCTTVIRMLDGRMYTVKLATKGSDVRLSTNSPDNIQGRQDYANFMLNLDPAVHTVYLDKTRFNLWLHWSQGHSPRGSPVRRTVTTQRGPNVTVCMAICANYGLVHSTVQRGGQTIVRFQQFIDNLAERCSELDADGSWLIVMDGPHFHRGVAVPQHLRERISIRILPAYSPFLNPSEFANSALKFRIKSRLAEAALVDEEAAAPDGITMEDWRFMLMEREAREAVPDTITAEKAAAWELRCNRLFGQCIQGHVF